MDFSQLLADVLPTSGGLMVVRAVAASALMFFIPGFAWTLIFFHKINVLERIVISIGLSIALVTLSVVVLNLLFSVGINGLNAVLTIVVITVIPLAIYFFRRYRAGRAKVKDES